MDNNEKEVLVEVKNLEVTFTNGKNKFVAVHDANFQVYRFVPIPAVAVIPVSS